MKELYPVPEGFKKTARTNEADYFERYQKSIDHPEEFWAEQANKLEWIKPFTKVKDANFEENNFNRGPERCRKDNGAEYPGRNG